jgi:urea transporter
VNKRKGIAIAGIWLWFWIGLCIKSFETQNFWLFGGITAICLTVFIVVDK